MIIEYINAKKAVVLAALCKSNLDRCGGDAVIIMIFTNPYYSLHMSLLLKQFCPVSLLTSARFWDDSRTRIIPPNGDS